jgi:hypothetical protein
MTRKAGTSESILGYSAITLKRHLEEQFLPGMSWDNYGQFGWHVDHKRPVSSFAPGSSVREVNALSNLQPLWWRDNLAKGAKTDEWVFDRALPGAADGGPGGVLEVVSQGQEGRYQDAETNERRLR